MSAAPLLDDIDASCLEQFKTLLCKETDGCYEVDDLYSIKSAQQRVFILTVVSRKELAKVNVSHLGGVLIKSIKEANGHLVLRIWKGASRWWNLNANVQQSCLDLASSEVIGYKLAREAFKLYYSKCSAKNDQEGIFRHQRICIPQMLYFQSNKSASQKQPKNPWAIFSFVKEINIITNEMPISESEQNLKFCDEFIDNMVKIRKEFGFDEPHPRHGRVCVENALEYAMHVLDTAVLPMQSIFFSFFLKESRGSPIDPHLGIEEDIFNKIRSDTNSLSGHNVRRTGQPVNYSDMILLYQEQIRHIRKVIQENQTEMASLVEYLENCIQRLLSEEEIVKEYPLAPVLCHMDLQPQNMILCQTTKLPTPTIPMIASILDWEESCYADARFEILLICRKVLANREQADSLWHHYSERVKATAGFSVGPIEPWLRLESVHTLLTMCMQGMNLLQGGRNPWEEESDLLKKIDRELYRLRNDLGWEA